MKTFSLRNDYFSVPINTSQRRRTFIKNNVFQSGRIFLLMLLCCGKLVVAQPVVSSFSPLKGHVGDTVTITGSGFASAPLGNIVYFGAVRAWVLTASANMLTVKVPAGATHKPLSVTVNRLTGYSAGVFSVMFDGGGISPGSFSTASYFSLNGERSWRTSVGDIDGDGKVDLIELTNYGGNVSILRNTSSIDSISFVFAASFKTSTQGTENSLEIADLDGDGKLDIVSSNESLSGAISKSFITILKNTSMPGSVSFMPLIQIPIPNRSVARVADMDLDGKPDLMSVGPNAPGIVFLKNTSAAGSISFNDLVSVGILGYTSMGIADLDGDLLPDLILNNFDYCYAYRNISDNGVLKFRLVQSLVSGSIWGISAGEINGDTRRDIAITHAETSGVEYRINRSTPGNIDFINYGMSPRTEFSPSQTLINDIDGDGRADLVASRYGDRRVYLSMMQQKPLNNSTQFYNGVECYMNRDVNDFVCADFNGDGRPDIAFTDQQLFSVGILKNQMAKASQRPVVKSFSPYAGGQNDTILIKGRYFAGTKAVSFGDVPAKSFTIVSDSTISAVLDTGASGQITVTNNKGAASIGGFIYTNEPTIKITTASTEVCENAKVTIEAVTTSRAPSLYYVWYKNGKEVGERNKPYVTTRLANGDSVWSVVVNERQTAKSNVLVFTVDSMLNTKVRISIDKPTTICKGTPVTFKAIVTEGGAAPKYKWMWNNGNVGTNSDTYVNSSLNDGDSVICIVSVAEKCAVASVRSKAVVMSVEYGAPAQPSSITGPSMVDAGASGLVFSVGAVSRATSYTWKVPADASVTSGGTTNEATVTWGNTAGNVTLQARNSCGLTSVSKSVTLNSNQSRLITESAPSTPKGAAVLSVYPNPAKNKVAVSFTQLTESGDYFVQLSDASGRLLLLQKTSMQKGGITSELDVSKYTPGIYHVSIMLKNKVVDSKQLMIGK